MKIGIDGSCLENFSGGVARILTQMLQLWLQLTNEHTFVLFFRESIPQDDFLRHSSIKLKLIKGPKIIRKRASLTQQTLLSFEIKREKLDLFFSPWYAAPLYCPCPKTVVGLWDISFVTHKSHYSFRERHPLSFLSKNSSTRADGIITCSEFDKRQIHKYYGIPNNSICALKLTADEKFKPIKNKEKIYSFRQKYNLPKKYILSLGVICNRRNVDIIIEAFKNVYEEFSDIGLVIVGKDQTKPFLNIKQKMQFLIDQKRGQYIERMPENDLVELYNGAWYYICTSTVDGTSIMLQEAMQCGTPVITSPLMEESVGESALIIQDPKSKIETSELFFKIIPSEKLHDKYAKKGLKWSESLSWMELAQESLAFINNIK